MAKIFKVSGYLIDDKGVNTEEQVKRKLDCGCYEWYGQHIHVKEAEINDWSKEHPLQYDNCDLAECEKYFKAEPTETVERTVKVGGVYKHFKGKVVKVLAVSQDTENVGTFCVVYECLDKDNQRKIWHRPLDMFLSEVDHEKYPNVEQKWRFIECEDN